MTASMFVLVHGAWSGAHGFRGVRALLPAAGRHVSTPSLTGFTEAVHLASNRPRELADLLVSLG